MWKRLLWCVLAVCAGGVTTLSHARDACPAARFGGPNGQGLYMWYSPYCDNGATGLWLPGNAVAENCPKTNASLWCVGGLGPKPKRVHDNLKNGYEGQAEPCKWDEPFVIDKIPNTQTPMPGTYKLYRVKVNLGNENNPKWLYCNLVRITIPESTISWVENGNPMELDLEAVTSAGGWQVKEPPAEHTIKYKEAYLAKAPKNNEKVARVVWEVEGGEEGEAFITDVVLHKNWNFTAEKK